VSVKATARAWDSGAEGAALLVLLALADHAGGEDDPYGHAYPCVSTLAEMCRLTTRSVQRWLRKLTDEGFVEETGKHDWGRGKITTVYRILDPRERLFGVTPVSGRHPCRGDTSVTQSVVVVDEPSEDLSSTDQEQTRAREKLPTFDKKPVKPDLWKLTQDVLEEFNRQARQKERLLTATGKLTDASSRIYGRVEAFPDLTFDEHAGIIAATLRSPWWGNGPATVSVVYGPKAFEKNVARWRADQDDPRDLSRFDRFNWD
jgi:hypothetical protein